MKASTLLPAIVAVTLAAPVEAGLYRWVDDNGNITYSDQVPPDQAGGGHAELNDTGIRVREVGPGLSAEEAERHRAEEARRLAAQQQAERQREADRILLRSFPSPDEIRMARDGKLNTYDHNIAVLSGYARRKKERLLDLQQQVEQLQRNGESPGKALTAEMANLEHQLVGTYSRILGEEDRKQAVRDEYDGYLRRFRELKGLAPAPDDTGAATGRGTIAALACTGGPECAALWERAIAYLKGSTGLPVVITTDALAITGQPARDEDMSLNLARVPNAAGDGHWIMLDIQCKATAVGHETCRGEASRAVLREFRETVSGDGPRAARTAPARTPPRQAPAG